MAYFLLGVAFVSVAALSIEHRLRLRQSKRYPVLYRLGPVSRQARSSRGDGQGPCCPGCHPLQP